VDASTGTGEQTPTLDFIAEITWSDDSSLTCNTQKYRLTQNKPTAQRTKLTHTQNQKFPP